LTLRRRSAYRNPLKGLGEGGMAEKTVSLRGLKCPLPALRTKKLLAGLQSGDELTIECTDPLSAIDIPNLLRQTGDTLASQSKDGELLVFRIRKK
jgi:tRNA 2-thiouridine synthesizing protein A